MSSGCGCKEVYRFPHITYPYSSCICSFLQQHPYFFYLLLFFFIKALPVIADFLSSLFTVLLRHGYLPACLKDCILVPVPKSGKDPTNVDNYRPIALASTLSKALEWCILIQFEYGLSTSDFQFGFKPGLFTTLCTGLLVY